MSHIWSPLCPRSHLWARSSEPRGFVSLPTRPPVWPKLRRTRHRLLLEAVDGYTRRKLGYLVILISDPYRPVHTLQCRLENYSVGTRHTIRPPSWSYLSHCHQTTGEIGELQAVARHDPLVARRCWVRRTQRPQTPCSHPRSFAIVLPKTFPTLFPANHTIWPPSTHPRLRILTQAWPMSRWQSLPTRDGPSTPPEGPKNCPW